MLGFQVELANQIPYLQECTANNKTGKYIQDLYSSLKFVPNTLKIKKNNNLHQRALFILTSNKKWYFSESFKIK